MGTIFRKELADQFSSTRFLILFCLIAMIALVTTYMVGTTIKEELEGIRKPTHVFLLLFTTSGRLLPISLAQFIAFFGPLVGIVAGFDAINRERNSGTLSKLVSQPIFRDAVINGKFLAGVTTISIMLVSLVLVISGLGLLTIGVVPGWDEVGRLLVYLVVSIAYVSFWLGLAILFSIFFRSIATSALAAGALWIFLSFFISFAASLFANVVAPIENPNDLEEQVEHSRVAGSASLASPVVLYSRATSTLLDPFLRGTGDRLLGRIEKASMDRFEGPLPLGQSVMVVVPYLTLMIALTVVCFGLSYVSFMRQEIRST